MSFSKIPSYLMYMIVGITVLIMGLFYFGDSLIDTNQYNAKLKKIENSAVKSSEANIIKDLQSADSLSVQADSSVTEESNVIEPAAVPTNISRLNFMEKLVYNKTDIAIMWGFLLLLIAVITALIFPMIYTLANPSNIIRSLLVLVGIAILIGVSYLFASDTTINIPGYLGTDNSNPVVLKVIDTGLIFMYFMLGLALLSILYAEVAKYFK